MSKLIKNTLSIIGILIAPVTAALFVGYFVFSSSIPEYSGEYKINGLHNEVKVIRDVNAVPHITSLAKEKNTETDMDVFFSLGFVHAQDRIWQMELWRRLAQGRLAEIFSNKKISGHTHVSDIDHFLRALDIYKYAKQSLAIQSKYSQQALKAYSMGINSWLQEVNNRMLKSASPELMVFQSKVDPWTELDSIAILKLVALDLSRFSLAKEINITKFLLKLDTKQVAQLFMGEKERQRVTLTDPRKILETNDFLLPDETTLATTNLFDIKHSYANAVFNRLFNDPDFSSASNAWAVSKKRSTTGGALLATEPHLALYAPSLWYLAHIELQSGNIIGASLPGVPLILSGRNDNIAWGITHIRADTIDIYSEKVNPDNQDQYLTSKGWKSFDHKVALINISDGNSIRVKIRKTDHGPVIPKIAGIKDIIPEGHVPSFAWTGLTGNDMTFDGALGLMKSSTITSGASQIKKVSSPTLNIIIADKNDVEFISVGRVPIRKKGNLGLGYTVSPGWVEDYDWSGYLNSNDLNSYSDIPKGEVVISTNNDLTMDSSPALLGNDWEGKYRSKRLMTLIKDNYYHSMKTFEAAQNDNISEMANSLLPLIGLKIWWFNKTPEESMSTHQRIRDKAIDYLADWDKSMRQDKPQPLIFYAWIRKIFQRVVADELGNLVHDLSNVQPHFLEAVFKNEDGASEWCDIVYTSEKENCAEIASTALNDAIKDLSNRYGKNIDDWSWGRAHNSLNIHVPFGFSKKAGWFFNLSFPSDGANYTVTKRKIDDKGEKPYQSSYGGSYRAVYNLNNLELSNYAIATGQSGHFLSKYYENFTEIWRTDSYIKISTDPETFKIQTAGEISLLPVID